MGGSMTSPPTIDWPGDHPLLQQRKWPSNHPFPQQMGGQEATPSHIKEVAK